MAHDSVEIARTGIQQERITIAFLVLAWVFILLRIWTRTYVISSLGWDDLTMILAGMIFTVYCSAELYIEANGGGTHITNVALLQLLTKWVVITEATYIMTMMVTKISLAIFFARIIVKRWHFLLIYTTVGINIFSSAAAFFYCLFRCGPNLDKYVIQQLGQQCTPHGLDEFMAYQQAAFTTLTDAVFVMLTLLILWNANMNRRSKCSVGFVLLLAAVGCICSMIRFRYVDGLTQTDDFFWNAVNVAIWSTIEAGACIIAGCLATLRPLLKRAISQTRSSSQTLSSSSLYGRVKQMSKSLRSGSQSNSSSNASSIPRSNAATSNAKSEREARGAVENSATEQPTCVEFLARPDEDVAALGSDTRNRRKSTDLILGQRGDAALEFPWPMKPDRARQKDRSSLRQSIHTSETPRAGVEGDGRTSDRPISALELPELYEQGGDSAV